MYLIFFDIHCEPLGSDKETWVCVCDGCNGLRVCGASGGDGACVRMQDVRADGRVNRGSRVALLFNLVGGRR